MKIISGGQTGIDQAALIAARLMGLPTGGTAPAGYRTSAGNNPKLLKALGLVEHSSNSYTPRTAVNVRDSDFTVMIYEHGQSAGEIQTRKFIKLCDKHHVEIDLRKNPSQSSILHCFDQFHLMKVCGKENSNFVINFAGNSEQTCPGIFVRSLPTLGIIMRILRSFQIMESKVAPARTR